MRQNQLILTIIITIFFFSASNLFAQKKANLEGIEIGEMAPEIELPTVDGETIKLSQLKGKVVLINFGAAWCVPCRKKTPALLEVLNNYKDSEFDNGEKGFVVFSVSLDKNVIAWKNSIEKDGTEGFINVGDMKAWKSTAAITYNIKSIPSSVLIDGKGKVIAINLRTKDLKKKLKRMEKGSWFWF